jgi:AcrR family transcriptional regulator
MNERKPRDPSRHPLTRERILRAAFALAVHEGISTLSMRRLGSMLGVEAMSLHKACA